MVGSTGEPAPQDPTVRGFDLNEYAEETRPGTRARRELELSVFTLGWSNIFELLPPGVAEAYQEIARALQPLTDFTEQAPTMANYVEAVSLLDQYTEEFGLWWGLPPAQRLRASECARNLASEPFTPNQLERLKNHWVEADGSVELFDELVAHDDLGVLDQETGDLVPSPDSGEAILNQWRLWRSRVTATEDNIESGKTHMLRTLVHGAVSR